MEIAPLACEFGVERIPAFRGYAGRQDLRIRPARLGKGGHWVRSGIGWDDLDFVARSYVPEHRELLLQFRAAAGSSARYTLPRSAWLSLSTVGSGFWGLLDQAGPAGLALITAAPLRGPLRTESRPRCTWTHRGDDGGLRLRPRVLVEDRPLAADAVGVLGEPAHGVFWLQPGRAGTEDLSGPAGAAARPRAAAAAGGGRAPSRFPRRTSPASGPSSPRRCGSRSPLASTDGSVRMPDAVPPTLALTVYFEPDHRVRLDWAGPVRRPGDGRETFPLDEPAGGPRHPRPGRRAGAGRRAGLPTRRCRPS